ncbi:MAG: hypothetical protein HWE16_06245 [Gammaproteobacteria bacterium]|nr:hypothetical protein [Gammaproteobacteria bacterium]
MKRITLLALAALLSTFAAFPIAAQTIFDVEVVFFKRLDVTGQFNYLAKDENSVSEQKYTLNNPVSLPADYSTLERAERKLEGVFNRLRASANMRPLAHFAWRQPLNDKDDTPWVSFAVSDEPEQKGLLDFIGNIRFSRNQGLLVEALISGFKAADPNIIIDESDEQMPDQLAGYFILDENRKVKVNKLNYFDHPTMGILVRVTPYQATLEEQEAFEAEQAVVKLNNKTTSKDS